MSGVSFVLRAHRVLWTLRARRRTRIAKEIQIHKVKVRAHKVGKASGASVTASPCRSRQRLVLDAAPPCRSRRRLVLDTAPPCRSCRQLELDAGERGLREGELGHRSLGRHGHEQAIAGAEQSPSAEDGRRRFDPRVTADRVGQKRGTPFSF